MSQLQLLSLKGTLYESTHLYWDTHMHTYPLADVLKFTQMYSLCSLYNI